MLGFDSVALLCFARWQRSHTYVSTSIVSVRAETYGYTCVCAAMKSSACNYLHIMLTDIHCNIASPHRRKFAHLLTMTAGDSHGQNLLWNVACRTRLSSASAPISH